MGEVFPSPIPLISEVSPHGPFSTLARELWLGSSYRIVGLRGGVRWQRGRVEAAVIVGYCVVTTCSTDRATGQIFRFLIGEQLVECTEETEFVCDSEATTGSESPKSPRSI